MQTTNQLGTSPKSLFASLLAGFAQPGGSGNAGNGHGNDFDDGDAMRDLNHQLKQLCCRNHDGSFGTQSERERALTLMANQLHALGFHNMQATSLKPEHVEALVEHWKAEDLSAGTIKNRMSHLRWWAEKVDKSNVIAKGNDSYGIADRKFVTNVSKGVTLQEGQLDKISDPYSRLSLETQRLLACRREESIKFNVSYADRGDKVVLKASWCKGGRAREIPIRTAEQRALLEAIKALCGKGSLIPADSTYIQQRNRFTYQCEKAGIHGVHGLRHAYAQARYQELTGWACPALGGPTSRQLSAEQKDIDREARLTISRELGHEREQVTAIYLGR